MRMPEIDGPALYREVLARWPGAASHVLFVFGMTERAPDPPLDVPVLIKPFSLEELLAAVARVLATL
jgi:DNA-binding response OmpR family regulator